MVEGLCRLFCAARRGRYSGMSILQTFVLFTKIYAMQTQPPPAPTAVPPATVEEMTEEKTKEKKRKRKSEVVEADATMEDAPAAVEEDEEARKQRKKEKKEKKRKEKEEAAKLEEQGVVSSNDAIVSGEVILTWIPSVARAEEGEKVQR